MAQHDVAAQAEPNPFATDPSDELPVGLQLTWRLRALISTGQLASGERLPSFRRLAEWAGVNLNTVRAVYEGLEADGLVVSRQGQGTFVAKGVKPAPELEEIATDALRRASEAGLGPRDLAIVAMACASIPGSVGVPAPAPRSLPDLEEESEAIEVRQELRRQIGRLEAELASYARYLSAEELPTAPRRAVAHVAGVQELEQTRDTLIAQLSEAQKAAEQRVRREAQSRARRQRAQKGEESESQRSGGPLGRAMSWWRAKP
ncbi:MAG TPA: GntR family transcriptional regulator [Solirubrobacterales bacterium]|jgi:DNA-binding transcriptional regulator YhcF (GntR family)|nr:GntR family transcriptional regulator [Solirubrobacterales bacterium]